MSVNKKVKELRGLFPKTIKVHVQRSKDGGFVASILSFPGVVTQAESFSELIEMVNDAIRVRLNIPAKQSSYMPTYLPPISSAQDLDIYPVRRVDQEITFRLPEGAKASR